MVVDTAAVIRGRGKEVEKGKRTKMKKDVDTAAVIRGSGEDVEKILIVRLKM